MSRIILIFTCLAVMIACLGLFGLSSFTAEQRSKEISIRKVMGATVSQVLMLLSKDFTRLVIISFIIAIPVTWYGMNKWLEGFAYRVNFDFIGCSHLWWSRHRDRDFNYEFSVAESSNRQSGKIPQK